LRLRLIVNRVALAVILLIAMIAASNNSAY
jgi:hypothetical protein